MEKKEFLNWIYGGIDNIYIAIDENLDTFFDDTTPCSYIWLSKRYFSNEEYKELEDSYNKMHEGLDEIYEKINSKIKEIKE